jgi:hypothetical protein
MIPLLRPGEEITTERLNRVIAAVNAAQITSSDFPIERTSAGTKLKLARRPRDFYAEIVEPTGADGKPIRERWVDTEVNMGEYEWREVYLPPPSDADATRYGAESLFRPLPDGRSSIWDAQFGKLYNPAYELSGHYNVPAGALVRMRVYEVASENEARQRGVIRRYVFQYVAPEPQLLLAVAVDNWEENGVYPEGNPRILCQRLVSDLDTDPTASEPHPKRMDPPLSSGTPFFVELPRERKGSLSSGAGWSHSTDPALYNGDRLYYTLDDQGRLICQSPYLHMGKIGDIRIMGKLPAGRNPFDFIPTGWWECNGDTMTGNAGNITLANFDRDYTALSGNTDKYGAGPVHSSSSYDVGDQCMHATFDAHGESTFARIPFSLGPPPVTEMWYDTSEELAGADAHRHDIKSAQGEFPMETVFFYQRYR